MNFLALFKVLLLILHYLFGTYLFKIINLILCLLAIFNSLVHILYLSIPSQLIFFFSFLQNIHFVLVIRITLMVVLNLGFNMGKFLSKLLMVTVFLLNCDLCISLHPSGKIFNSNHSKLLNAIFQDHFFFFLLNLYQK